MESKVQPKILDAAIKLFGEYGFEGVTTRDLAKEADVVEGSIYQWYKSKQNLYQQAINTVIARQFEDLGRFLVTLHGSTVEHGMAQQITEAVRMWYSSLSQPAARLLQQVLIADAKRYKDVRNLLDKVINIIAKTLDEWQKKTNRQSNAQAAAKTLVYSLFQIKVTYRKAAEADADSKEFVEEWLLGLAVGQ
jgi:AcrR family transcriptional regulator